MKEAPQPAQGERQIAGILRLVAQLARPREGGAHARAAVSFRIHQRAAEVELQL
jgi:hypothetical protein